MTSTANEETSLWTGLVATFLLFFITHPVVLVLWETIEQWRSISPSANPTQRRRRLLQVVMMTCFFLLVTLYLTLIMRRILAP